MLITHEEAEAQINYLKSHFCSDATGIDTYTELLFFAQNDERD